MDKNFPQITLEITNKSQDFIGLPIYAIGNFNQWNSNGYLLGTLPLFGETKEFTLEGIKEGFIELKISRGSWDNLTCSADGQLLPPYTLDRSAHSRLKISIESWRDLHSASTASPQVQLLDEAFYFPHLDTHKKIWIYLPPGYNDSTERYPVLYMHDGEQLFDEATAMGKKGPVEWQVDKTINTFSKKAIVIGIAAAKNKNVRKEEYLIHPHQNITKPQGLTYLKDIVRTLKPFIDQNYRTLSDRANTAMVGSSLGGLVSLYAGLYYPEIFGSLGILSPSIWLDDKQKLYKTTGDLLNARQGNLKQNYFFYGGELETRPAQMPPVNMCKNILEYTAILEKHQLLNINIQINPTGKHGNLYWQKIFPDFYKWWISQQSN